MALAELDKKQRSFFSYNAPNVVEWFAKMVEESCVGCGLCAAKCPTQTIRMERIPKGMDSINTQVRRYKNTRKIRNATYG